MCHQSELLAEFILGIAAADRTTEPAELVIAGDFIDFLAEKPIDSPEPWLAFHRNPEHARQIFERVAEGVDEVVFAALKQLLARGHRLTILLGNHDLELSFPVVRNALAKKIGASRGDLVDFEFIYDGEAYVVGDLVIEHGNDADPVNRVDYDPLRRIRVHQSNRTPDEANFSPPYGSRIVADIMNDVKHDFPFVDLLKPEGRGAFLVLFALNPKRMSELPDLVAELARAGGRSLLDKIRPSKAIDIAAGGESSPDPFVDWIREVLPEDEAAELIQGWGLGTGSKTADIGARAYVERFVARKLLKRFFDEKGCFDASAETGRPYLRAAEKLIRSGFRCVVFGHTHLAVDVQVEVDGKCGKYLNSGTWADLIRLPDALRRAIRSGNDKDVTRELKPFLEAMKTSDFEKYILRRPTFARIQMDEFLRVVDATTCCYRGGDPRLSPGVLGAK